MISGRHHRRDACQHKKTWWSSFDRRRGKNNPSMDARIGIFPGGIDPANVQPATSVRWPTENRVIPRRSYGLHP